jgi:C-terminal peptidase prc
LHGIRFADRKFLSTELNPQIERTTEMTDTPIDTTASPTGQAADAEDETSEAVRGPPEENETAAEENESAAEDLNWSEPESIDSWLATAGPKGLYDIIWSWTPNYIDDKAKLGDWDSWRFRFDDQIHSFDDAAAFAKRMLASLNDHVACVDYGRGLAYLNALSQGIFLGTGMVIAPDRTEKHLLLKDDQGSLMPKFDQNGFPIVTWVIQGSPAEFAGIKAGDSVSHIDGESTVNQSIRWLDERINGSEGTTLLVKLRRNYSNSSRSRRLNLTQEKVPLNNHYKRLGNVGYIRLESFFDENTDAQVARALTELADCKGYIIDVRGTPGGRSDKMAQVVSLFLDQGKICLIDGPAETREYILTETEVRYGSDQGDWWNVKRWPNLSEKKPIVIMISPNTRSAPEVLTSALREHGRATVLGEASFGKGVAGTLARIGTMAALEVPIGRWYTSSGKWLGDAAQTIHSGLYPDVEVKPNRNIVFGGRNDNQLRAARALIKEQISARR